MVTRTPLRTWSGHDSPGRAVNLAIWTNYGETLTVISGNPNLFRRIGRWIRVSASLNRPRSNKAAMHRRLGDLHRSPYQSRSRSFAPRGDAVAGHRPGASECTYFLDFFSRLTPLTVTGPSMDLCQTSKYWYSRYLRGR